MSTPKQRFPIGFIIILARSSAATPTKCGPFLLSDKFRQHGHRDVHVYEDQMFPMEQLESLSADVLELFKSYQSRLPQIKLLWPVEEVAEAPKPKAAAPPAVEPETLAMIPNPDPNPAPIATGTELDTGSDTSAIRSFWAEKDHVSGATEELAAEAEAQAQAETVEETKAEPETTTTAPPAPAKKKTPAKKKKAADKA